MQVTQQFQSTVPYCKNKSPYMKSKQMKKKRKGYNKMLIAYVIVFESYCKFYFLYFPNVLKIYSSDILKKNK